MGSASFDVGFDDTPDEVLLSDPDLAGQPYPGGRAQAEAGSKIIEDDYLYWVLLALNPAGLEAGHPRIAQLGDAWRAIRQLSLNDDPGQASARYQILSHAAGALALPAQDCGLDELAGALHTLQQHAAVHGQRLYATSIDLFARSGKAGPYRGRGEATSESRVVADHYGQWNRVLEGIYSSAGPATLGHVSALIQEWVGIQRYRQNDGPGPAASRYEVLSESARTLSRHFGPDLPSAALGPLITLALNADKYAMRLHSTAATVARTGTETRLPQATWEQAVACGHAGIPRAGQHTPREAGSTRLRVTHRDSTRGQRDQ